MPARRSQPEAERATVESAPRRHQQKRCAASRLSTHAPIVVRISLTGHLPPQAGKPNPPPPAMKILLTTLWVTIQAILITALADFWRARFIGWKTPISPKTPLVIGPALYSPEYRSPSRPALLHAFVLVRQSSWDLAAVGAILPLLAWPLGLLGWQLGLFVALSINANEIHKMSHRTRAEKRLKLVSQVAGLADPPDPAPSRIASFRPQKYLLLPDHEFRQSRARNASISGAAWKRSSSTSTGVTHRQDTAVRGKGPGPAWLASFRSRAEITGAPVGQTAPRCGQCPRANFANSKTALNHPNDNRNHSTRFTAPKASVHCPSFSSMTSSERLHVVTGSLASRKRRPWK